MCLDDCWGPLRHQESNRGHSCVWELSTVPNTPSLTSLGETEFFPPNIALSFFATVLAQISFPLSKILIPKFVMTHI